MDCTENSHPANKLTDDLLIDILSRLPIKSLLLCRGVSKSWRALISDSRYQKKLPQTMCGLFYHARILDPGCWGYGAEYVSLQNHNGSNFADINLGFFPCNQYTVEDFSNGLLLCHSWKGRSSTYYVCNPATKRWAELPKPDFEFRPLAVDFNPHISSHYIVLGFRMERSSGINIPVVFSSETRKWIEKQAPPRCGKGSCIGGLVLLNGSIRFLPYSVPIVVAIDVKEEIYRKIELPGSNLEMDYLDGGYLGESQGYLHYVQKSDNHMAVWVLSNYNENKWILKHSISFETLFQKQETRTCATRAQHLVQNLTFHPDLDVLFLKMHAKLFSYHMVSARLTEIPIPSTDTRRFYAYTPCLLEDIDL